MCTNPTDFDPLTVDIFTLLRFVGWRPCDCPPEAYHHELCWVTPIYAELCRTSSSPREVVNTMLMEYMEYPCQTTVYAPPEVFL